MALAFVMILFISPFKLFAVGFQLSFSAVAAIAMLNQPFSHMLHFLPKPTREALSISLCGTIGTLPMILYHFERFTPYAIFANILILPLVSIALICSIVR